MRYHIQEGTIELSDHHWQDRTVHVLSCEEFPIRNVNIVITREDLPLKRQLDAHIDEIAKTFQEKLQSYELKRHEKGVLDGRPSHFFEMGWVEQGKFIAQLVLYVEDKGQLFSLTATALGGLDEETRSELLGILRSFKFSSAGVAGDDVAEGGIA